jgi:hypothetical protein
MIALGNFASNCDCFSGGKNHAWITIHSTSTYPIPKFSEGFRKAYLAKEKAVMIY